MFGSSAKAAFIPMNPYNVLVNPSAETGNYTGWNTSDSGYLYVVSTNGVIPGDTRNFLAHDGTNTFQLFDTTSDQAVMWQDFPAVANSQWSASAWAICYASNYFDSAFSYMSVAFYDTNGNVLGASFDPGFSSYGQGVYIPFVLDPVNTYVPYIISPPQAIDATGWLYCQATNFWYSYTPANTNGAPGTNVEGFANLPITVATNLTAPPGTAFVRYQIEFDNHSTDGGDVYWDDLHLNKLNQTDPDFTNPYPSSATCYVGDPASFTVVAVSAIINSKAEKISYQWQMNGTNLSAIPGGSIAGNSTNATLSFTNCQVAAQGTYTCVASDVNGSIRSIPLTLTVLALSPYEKADVLGPNFGFENNPHWTPWETFNGAYFNTTNNFLDAGSTVPVNVFDGKSVCLIGGNGDRDNGIHHAWGTGAGCVTVTNVIPNSVWKAGGWVYIPSVNPFVAGNTCRLQIWFRDAAGNSLTDSGTPTFESTKIYGLAYTNSNMQYTNVDQTHPDTVGQVMYHSFLPNDTWNRLVVSNVVNNAGIGLADDLPTGTWQNEYFLVPTNVAGVTQINYQIYEYCPVSSDVGPAGGYLGSATDSTYWDDLWLIQVTPVTNLTAKASAGNMNLSFNGGAGLNYIILYKTNLTDAAWNTLLTTNAPLSWQNDTTQTGTQYPLTVPDPVGGQQRRFYRIQVQ